MSQFCFDLPKMALRNNSEMIILFKKISKDVKNIHWVTVGFGNSYNEFKKLCKEAGKNEEYNCYYSDISGKVRVKVVFVKKVDQEHVYNVQQKWDVFKITSEVFEFVK